MISAGACSTKRMHRRGQNIISELGVVAVFRAKRRDHRIREDLIEFKTPCHDASMVGSYLESSRVYLAVLAARVRE